MYIFLQKKINLLKNISKAKYPRKTKFYSKILNLILMYTLNLHPQLNINKKQYTLYSLYSISEMILKIL